MSTAIAPADHTRRSAPPAAALTAPAADTEALPPETPAETLTEAALRLGKRSVVIAGHKTSVSLEAAFWRALRKAADRRHWTINQLVTEIDRARVGNLSSAIRVFLLHEAAVMLDNLSAII